ncbi:unnamed protein product [Orchesella dallaii]|uniref:Uncharacterized protein n=1 Tax=Orchesella dallaii TaxID=48710 RepID=A0ABP1RIE9_9HEXA
MAQQHQRKPAPQKKIIAAVLALNIVIMMLTICEGSPAPFPKQGECWPKQGGHSQAVCLDSGSCNNICRGDGNEGGYCSWVMCYCHGCP